MMKLISKLTEEQVAHFWSRVDIKDENKCWNWTGCLNRGYGQFSIQHTNYKSHRIAYFLSNKKDPKKLLVCHACDNRKCCNPNHLWLGTIADDIRDMLTKDRGAKGSKNGLAKLTEAQVRQIRKQYAKGKSQDALGKQYGIHQTTIQCIVTRKTWTHI